MEFLNTAFEMGSVYFTTAARWIFLFLSIFILARQIKSLLQAKNPSEIWAYLGCPDDTSVPLTHWENLIGRSRGCDVILNLKNVSRSHGTLIRDSEGVWKYNDLNSKNGSLLNGRQVTGPTPVKAGDILTIAGSDFTLYPVSLEERMSNIEKRKRKTHPVSPWPSMLALTIFQILMVLQFRVSLAEEFPVQLPLAVFFLGALMWVYVIVMRMFKRVGFEMEMIAFYLSTLSIAVTTAAYPGTEFKQAICVGLGVVLFFGLCWFLRDLNRAKKIVYIMLGISTVLLLVNLVFGSVKNGSMNWVTIGGFSFQPSEFVKIVFIYVGAATLDELQQRKNLTIFMLFSAFCLGCLAIMGDFGTAMIFFVTFLVISFLRSGDFSKIALIVGAAALMGMMVLRFKPYIADRVGVWGHVWDDPTDGGFQQVQTMTSAASGGIPGLGAGEGAFSDTAAASTDLVFGLLAEEWGIITAILAVLCIITLGVFAVRSIIAGRSTYYSIAACSATSLFIFQTILNVFGSVDLLPLTGVTFPFVSSGGSSMIASWGLLAFLKAADTRQNASFAIKLDKKGDFDEEELQGGTYSRPEEIINEDTAYYKERTRVNEDRAVKTRRTREKEPPQEGGRRGKKPRNDVLPNKRMSSKRDETTMLSMDSGAPRQKSIHYENVSDDDFFKNLENIRPEENFARRMDRNAPQKQPQRRPAQQRPAQPRTSQQRPAQPRTSQQRPAQPRTSQQRPAQPRTSQQRPPQPRTSSQRPSENGVRGTSQKSRNSQRQAAQTRPQQRPASPRPQRPAQQRPPQQRPRPEDDDNRLTLEDIFGGDDK